MFNLVTGFLYKLNNQRPPRDNKGWKDGGQNKGGHGWKDGGQGSWKDNDQ